MRFKLHIIIMYYLSLWLLSSNMKVVKQDRLGKFTTSSCCKGEGEKRD